MLTYSLAKFDGFFQKFFGWEYFANQTCDSKIFKSKLLINFRLIKRIEWIHKEFSIFIARWSYALQVRSLSLSRPGHMAQKLNEKKTSTDFIM